MQVTFAFPRTCFQFIYTANLMTRSGWHETYSDEPGLDVAWATSR